MLDPAERTILHDVKAFGWHCLCVEADEEGPAFAYTIGLQPTFKHPEVIIFGLPPQSAHGVMQSIVGAIKEGASFAKPCESTEILTNFPVAFDVVQRHHFDEYFGAGLWFRRHKKLRSPLKAIQCFWPDNRGKFPWQRACDKATKLVQTNLCTPKRRS